MRKNLGKFLRVVPTIFESAVGASAKLPDYVDRTTLPQKIYGATNQDCVVYESSRHETSNITLDSKSVLGDEIEESSLKRHVIGRLVITRHGETALNADKIWTGHHDAPLTEKGHKQAENLGKSLRENNFRPNIVLLSPLLRSMHTASIALGVMDCYDAKIEHLIALVELSPGDHTLKPKNADNKKFTKSWDVRPPQMAKDHELHPENIELGVQHRYFFPMPFGESFEDVESRTRPVYDYINELLKDGQDVFVVAHSNSLSALFSHFSGEKTKVKLDNCSPIEIELEEKEGELVFVRTKKLEEMSVEDRGVFSSQISGIKEDLSLSEIMPSCVTKMAKASTLEETVGKGRNDDGRI